jgi:hypothetical protein
MPAKRNSALIAAILASPLALIAQTTPPQAAKAYTTPRQSKLTQQFSDFLAIPNVAADPANLRRNAEFLVAQLQQRGAEAKLLNRSRSPRDHTTSSLGRNQNPRRQTHHRLLRPL